MHSNIDSSVLAYLKSLTLLCVEDNKTTQLIYDSIFENLVEKIVFADDGEDGYQKFCNEKIDLIISDYDMPVLNGIAMIEKIRNRNKNIPIILVSAIQDIDVIVQALQLNVNNFLKKPIKSIEVMQAIENVSKILIADNYLKDIRDKKIKDFEQKEEYNSYQEDLAFSKELNILQNDFYYQMIDMKYTSFIDFMYKPLDVLSGDAYSARKIDNNRTFYLLVDGMGKGLSASLSAMLITSFINHIINVAKEFNLKELIESSLEYIRPILLEEESLSIDYIVIDYCTDQMQYAKFAMPSTLTQTSDNKIIKIKSNNPPLSKYLKDFNISSFDISNIIKFLFYSDGMVENDTKFKNRLYSEFIENDFLTSFSKEDLREKFLWKIDTQEDDITFIFLHRLNLHNTIIASKSFLNTLDEIENANGWYADIWENMCSDINLIYRAGVVFSELFMNAYEHGNFGITSEAKHQLLENNTYFRTLETKESECNKKIKVTINKIEYENNSYIITSITDEGNGFDTKILREIFRNLKRFNGRGVFVSRRSSLGIYYNTKGNSVLYLHKIHKEKV
jgi:CheY-like chemotaxis protein